MSAFQRVMGWMDDQLNPIVVKELRQAVQGRFLSWVLLGFLLLQMILLGGSLLSVDVSSTSWISSRAGRTYFSFLQAILLGTCMLFVPMYTGVRMSLERTDQNADLMFISTLSPRAIVVGKFQSAVVLTILIFSACAPFMTVSYLLRGIDLPSIFSSLGISFLAILGGIQLAIFAACLPVGRFVRIILGVVLLGILFSWFLLVTSFNARIVRLGIAGMLGSRHIGWVVTLLFLSYVSVLAILFVLSVALLSTPSSNRVLPVRVVLSIIWVVSAVLALVFSFVEHSFRPIFGWTLLVSLTLAIILFFTINERESIGYRVTKTIPKNKLLRVLVFPFYSGVYSGVVWVFLSLFATLVVIGLGGLSGYFWAGWRHFSFNNEWMIPSGGLLFAFNYSATGYLIRRRWFQQVRSGFTWTFALFVFAACSILPMLFAFFLGFWRNLQEGSMIFTPFVLGSYKYKETGFVIALVWSALMLVWILPQVIRYFTRFLSYEPERGNEGNVSTVSA